MTETWYVWRFLGTCGGDRRLYVPWADPMKHEFPFDFLFETPAKAHEGLRTYGAEDDAREEHWVLCRLTLEVVSACSDDVEALAKLQAILDVEGPQAVNPEELLTATELRLYAGYATPFRLRRVAVKMWQSSLIDIDVDHFRELTTKEEITDYIVKARFGDES